MTSVSSSLRLRVALQYALAILTACLAAPAQAATPFIVSLTPASANAGDPGVTISISGVNFAAGAVTFWDNTVVASSLLGTSLIVATVPANLITSPKVATITVANPDGGRSNGMTFAVNQPALSITSVVLPNASTGTQYSATLTAAGGTPPYTWTVADALPRGLTLSAAGTITGTPLDNGNFTFTVKVTDRALVTTTRQLQLSIALPPVFISTASPLPSATVGAAYSQALAVSGGTQPYRWSVSGSLPGGLSLNPSTGVLSGTPDAKGTFNFTVQVADNGGISASKAFALTVNAANLVITTVAPLFNGTVGIAYSQTFQASGGVPPYTWSITSGQAGNGLSLDRNTGVLAGTPADTGSFNFTVQVTDSTATSTSKAFTVVIELPKLNIISSSPLPAGAVGTPYTFKFAGTGGTQPYSWSTSGAASGLTMDNSTGTLSGTPSQAGTFNFTVQLRDRNNASTTKTFALTVNPGPLSIDTNLQLPGARVRTPYTQVLSASGGTPPYTWSANGLPDGLSLDSSTGTISGSPLVGGPLVFTVRVTDSARATVVSLFHITIELPALPDVTISGMPDTANPTDQPAVKLSLASTYPVDISGQLVLSFAPESGPGDSTVQFSSGGRTVNFTIPAGSTASDLPAGFGFQAGTVAGVITISAQLLAAGVDITPAQAPVRRVRIDRAGPVITSAKLARSGSGFSIQVTGYCTSREVTQAVFKFKASGGATLQQSEVTVPLDAAFSKWFQDPASARFGSQFLFVMPFTTQGDSSAVSPDSVTLSNRTGSATATVN